ncbi:MAG: hypothetical protein WC477_04820 [Patescibacteria group bacterium]
MSHFSKRTVLKRLDGNGMWSAADSRQLADIRTEKSIIPSRPAFLILEGKFSREEIEQAIVVQSFQFEHRIVHKSEKTHW